MPMLLNGIPPMAGMVLSDIPPFMGAVCAASYAGKILT